MLDCVVRRDRDTGLDANVYVDVVKGTTVQAQDEPKVLSASPTHPFTSTIKPATEPPPPLRRQHFAEPSRIIPYVRALPSVKELMQCLRLSLREGRELMALLKELGNGFGGGVDGGGVWSAVERYIETRGEVDGDDGDGGEKERDVEVVV